MYILLWLLLLCEQLLAQNKGMVPVGKQLPAGTERRLALVIGNKNYVYAGRLNNTHNDADDMARVLQNLGFDVILKKDLSMVDFLKAIDDFGTKLGQYNVGLLYYSGHGIQYQGENYLVPIDAKANAAEDIEYTCVKLGRAMAKMEGAKLKVSLAFLDACRNNPFPSSSRAVGQGLTIPNNPPGSFVAFSTRAGSTADDNSSGRNGLFTSALLQNLPQANIGLRTMIDNVIETVAQRSGNSQIPGRYDELRGDFYFVSDKNAPSPLSPAQDIVPVTPPVVQKKQNSFMSSLPKTFIGTLKNTTYGASSSTEMTFSITKEGNVRLTGHGDDRNIFGRWDLTCKTSNIDYDENYRFEGIIDLGYEKTGLPPDTKATMIINLVVKKDGIEGKWIVGEAPKIMAQEGYFYLH